MSKLTKGVLALMAHFGEADAKMIKRRQAEIAGQKTPDIMDLFPVKSVKRIKKAK